MSCFYVSREGSQELEGVVESGLLTITQGVLTNGFGLWGSLLASL